MAKRKYRGKALAALHESVEGLHRLGLVDTKTMREFDASCLITVEELSPRQITALRKRAGVSQEMFARYLNVATGLVSKWERGEKQPQGPSLKLLSLVRKKGLEAIA
ncbi:MAG: DNA-binding transcriptional regulator [Deltaproteobacteria bacterium]|nr:DNA-binding transcriptional regulator [Deltaproteobacteria bacterium]